MDLLSIGMLGGGLVLIWAAVKNKSPLDAIKLLSSGKNPTGAKDVSPEGGGSLEDFGGGDFGGATEAPRGQGRAITSPGGSDPPMTI